MSEKYSTEELVEEITVAFEARIESIDDGYTKNIIIKEIASYDDDDSDEYIICQFKDLIQLRKAIADYGGKK